ncbi:MAG: hypothetical protein J7L45_00425, partial [Candidatus Aenigmarchaeota archaeon]|nr:hypothetical protein [Candidatus Aenigmarchaeota archaeon]
MALRSHTNVYSLFSVSLLLVILVFTSGCVNFNGKLGILGITPSGPNYTESENLLINAEVFPSEVIGGKEASLYFDVSNKGTTTINDFDLVFTDLCEFTGNGLEKKISVLKPGDMEQWNWKIKSRHVNFPMTCTLRYDVSYRTNSSARYDIAAVSEEEQERLLRKGEMNNIQLHYYKSKTPVEINMWMSEEQPVVENSTFYLYIKLNNVGSGYVDKIPAGQGKLTYPKFLEMVSCDDYDKDGNLKRDLKFYKGETKTSTCKFRVKEGTVISDIGSFSVKINYKYMY